MKLSLITINYNGSENTIKLLESLKNQTDKDFEIIVVDNNSKDVEQLLNYQTSETNIIFIKNERNLGFSGGNNVGIKKALENGSDWVLLLNNDTIPENLLIEHLKANLENKDGIIGLSLHEGGRMALAGKIEWLKPTLIHITTPDVVNPQVINKKHNNDIGCRYAIGGAMVVHKNVFNKIGLLDENYFLYFEDADFSLRALKAKISVEFIRDSMIYHTVSASTKKLGSPMLLRYHYRNALYFNWKNGPWFIKLLVWPWSWMIVSKQIIKILVGKDKEQSFSIFKGVGDWYSDKMGILPARRQAGMIKKIGIECESIEGKNPMWGIGRMTVNLLKQISHRPELEKDFRFILYFKNTVPDFPFLNAPIFEKKIVPVPFFKNRLFPIYYFALLPIKLWFEKLDVMFWPNYMLPILAFNKSLVMLTEDVYYETHEGKLPFRYRLAYRIFGWWTAKFATKIIAISETSKKNLARLYRIKPEKIVVNRLGVDFSSSFTKVSEGLRQKEDYYFLFVGQMFPRRHTKETILAFEKFILNNSNSQILKNLGINSLRLILIGPDKYEAPTIKNLIAQVNSKLGRDAVIHKDYVKDGELNDLYAGAKALVYVSNREAFGLPPMEALSFGVPPIIADNELGHELFGEYAFYTDSTHPEGIAESMRKALTQTEKIQKIKTEGPEFVKKYNWKSFTDQWLKIIRTINE